MDVCVHVVIAAIKVTGNQSSRNFTRKNKIEESVKKLLHKDKRQVAAPKKKRKKN